MMNNKSVYKSNEGRDQIIAYYREVLKEWPVPHEYIDIDTRFGRTSIIASGDKSGEPLILLHGSSTNSAMWMGDIGILSSKYRVFAVDIIGEPGLSDESRPELKPYNYSSWIMDIMDGLGIKKAYFTGNSLGTWISLSFAVNHPERVMKLVLIAAAGIGPFRKSFMFKVMLYGIFSRGNPDMINKIVNGDLVMPEKVLEFVRLIYKHYNPRIDLSYIFSDEELKKLTMPILYIAGVKDALIDTGKTVSRIKSIRLDATIDLRPDSGHAVINCAAGIVRFLDGKQN